MSEFKESGRDEIILALLQKGFEESDPVPADVADFA
jgi:hypothetical protein